MGDAGRCRKLESGISQGIQKTVGVTLIPQFDTIQVRKIIGI